MKTRSGLLERADMETIAARRMRKLQWLAKEKGGHEAIASAAGLNPATLDQILKGVLLPKKADGTRSPRALGSPAARAIEAAFDLGPGWFDSEDTVVEVRLTPDELDMINAYRQLQAQRGAAVGETLPERLSANVRADAAAPGRHPTTSKIVKPSPPLVPKRTPKEQ